MHTNTCVSPKSPVTDLADRILALTLDDGHNSRNELASFAPSPTSDIAILDASLLDAQTSIQAILDEDRHIRIDAGSSSSRLETVLSLKPLDARTRKAENIFLAIERNIRTSSGTLSFTDGTIPEPSILRPLLDSAADVVRSSGVSLAPIKSGSSEVCSRKENITQLLRHLDARINALRSSLPARQSDTSRIFISVGKHAHHTPFCHIPNPSFSDTVLNNPVGRLDVVAQIITVLGVICHAILGLSTGVSEFIISSAIILVKVAFTTGSNGSEPGYDTIQRLALQQLPTSLYTALSKFDIDGDITVYATCPSCNYTYKPVYDPISATMSYPENCSNGLTGEDGLFTCGAPLLEAQHGRPRPLKSYAVPSFRDHLVRLLSSSEIENHCDHACDDAFAALIGETNNARNVFHGGFMRSFEGPIRGQLFIDRQDKARLAFAMHVDFFNPNGVRERGNHNSIGIISLVLLNLPENIRYQPENIYLTIIPGPREPKVEEINHFTRPIIEEFRVGWERGFHVSHTASSPTGRDVDIAIVLSINDLPAARKVSGSAGHGSHFICTRCRLHGRDKLHNVDFNNWSLQDVAVLREKAEQWRDATTLRERGQIFDSYGVRWSTLWQLPYWNPPCMLIVDPMHCLLEGLVHYHCRRILQIDMQQATATTPPKPAFSFPWAAYTSSVPVEFQIRKDKEIGQVSSIHEILARPLDEHPTGLGDGPNTEKLLKKLLTKNKLPLQFVCHSLNLLDIPEARTKPRLAELLVNWVSHQILHKTRI